MKQINSNVVKIYLATQPENESNKATLQLLGLSTFTTAISSTTTDQKYFSNFGEVTKIVTGGALSVSLGVDYEPTDDLHKYLLNLSFLRFWNSNNQYMVLEMENLQTQKQYLYGKTAIQFKTIPSSGAADELVKLEFDIFPQDELWTISTTPPVWHTNNILKKEVEKK